MSFSLRIAQTFTSKLPPQPQTQKPQTARDIVKAIRAGK